MHLDRTTFGTLDAIRVDDPRTWRGRVFLTFDVDFASDEVLGEVAERVARAGVPATWLATHDTPVLETIRATPFFELGLHPDFERLLWDEDARGDALAVLEGLRAFAPEATSVRSHYLTQSTALSMVMAAHGVELESNTYIPFESGIAIRPWRHAAGHVCAPFGWADDLAAAAEGSAPVSSLLRPDGLNVLVLHPVHVVANTATDDQLDRVLSVLRGSVDVVREAVRDTPSPAGRLGSADHLGELLERVAPPARTTSRG